MDENLFELKDLKTTPDLFYPYPKDTLSDNPVVIDNGSFQCRAGWATQDKPCLVFKNLVAKTRRERGKKDGEIQVGNDIVNIEAVRFQLKTQFDRNVISHSEVQEQIFDYLFTHLGIDTEGSVNHPIVITEPFLNPNYCRQLVSELLFECYGVPGVSYGVDNLFSYQAEHQNKSGLIISLSHQTIHIIPVIKGKTDPSRSRRINLGGFHITGYFHRLLQLKYPVHFNAITLSRAEEMVFEHCALATDYGAELDLWADPDYYDDNVRRIQLPYTASTSTPSLTADQQREKRRELAKRLIEINARKRDERLAEDEEQLSQLLGIQELAHDGQEKYFQKALASFELSNEADLTKQIGMLRARIHRTKQKINAANAAEEGPAEEQKPKTKAILKPKEGEDFSTWLSGIKKERVEILEQRNARHQRRQDMAKRRTAAAQERMRIISELARKDKRDDNFGMRDEDWDVYKAIRKDGGDSDSEEEQVRLLELEEVLRHHDSSFQPSSSNANAVAIDSPLHPAEAHQLHVGVERFRAPELIFQPSMSGLTDAGLAETIGWVLKGYPADIQNELVNNVYITGGCAAIPGLVDRLTRELREIRPFQSTFKISVAKEPTLSAWLAMRDFALSDDLPKYLVTKEEYAEKGGELVKEHSASNIYQPSPAPVCQPAVTVEEMEIEIF